MIKMKMRLGIAILVSFILIGWCRGEQCGSQAGGALCPGGICCSKYGWCGSTSEYCGEGCQSQCGGSTGGGDLGSIISRDTFNTMLKHRDDGGCPAKGFYTYDAFISAAKAYPSFGTTGDTSTRKREIAAFFGQTSHETTGGWATAPDGPYAWGYCFVREQNPSAYCSPSSQWPCASGKQYYGRGPIQLSWNYNYGQCGRAIGADLLNNPDAVATDAVISFKTAIWFWMTAQSPKPSCHDVITGKWSPSNADQAAGRVPVSSENATKIGQGYRLISIEGTPDGGLVGLLQVNQKTNIYGPDIHLLRFYAKHETENRLRVHITDANKQRWEVPYNLLPREQPPALSQTIGRFRKNPIAVSEYSGSELLFSYTSDPFSFAVKRKSNGETLFDSSSGDSDPFSSLVFKDQYLEISTKLPEDASLYGLGEHTQPHGIKLYPQDPFTLYTTDIPAINLNADLYGSHPMYMDLRNAGGKASAHAVLLLNSNGMDVLYTGTSLTYKIIGGVFDFYFFSGPSPLNVVDQYTSLIGRPAPMPYWAFGFHQCRYGYHNLSVVEDVVENYKKAQIPLDVIWNDADHMDGYKDFTLNPSNYPRPELLNFLNKIHRVGMKYIVIIDPGIGVNSSYGVYQRGIANDVFIKYEGEPYLAQVWPGPVNFPDFLNPKTVSWWGDEIRRFHELVPIDGLWIDMNEVSNFCSGKCKIPKGKVCPSETGPSVVCCLECENINKTRWDDPPYKINASGIQAPIGHKTIATSAVHYNGILEYDAHSIYGFSQSIATHKALLGLEGKRPFILSRSTYVGSGKYAAHWSGDNQATWENLRYTISTMINFGIFGVPMIGSDICGFFAQPTEELCSRWIEVGAFYPFSRDHSDYYTPRQELYIWESVAESARNALGIRYKILPYLYTLNYEAHVSGAPIARPLFFSFPTYTECYGLSTQFLLGSSLMISPVLEPGKTQVKALFPPGSWYSLLDWTQTITSNDGIYVTLDAPLHVVNVHLYQNTILPMQQGGLISKDARMTPFSLIVTFPSGAAEGEAKGNLFLDDDELPEMKLGNGYSTYIDLHAAVKQGGLRVWSEVQEGKFALDQGWVIESISVLGLGGSGAVHALEINGMPVSDVKVSTSEHKHLDGQANGESKTGMVALKNLNIPLGENFALTWNMG